SARGFGGFADLLLETLERAGVNTDGVTFKGEAQLPSDSDEEGWATLYTDIPLDPRVPSFVPLRVRTTETTFSEAVQVTARRTLREVTADLKPHLDHTPYRYLPKVTYGPDFARAALHQAQEANDEVDERLRVASRCILYQDQALTNRDSEVDFLRAGWKRDVDKVSALERKVQELQRELDTNRRHTEVQVATLNARNEALEAEDRNRAQQVRTKDFLLQEKEELVESSNNALLDAQEKVWELERWKTWNTRNLMYLGSQLLYNQDRGNRIAAAWRRSDRKRVAEVEEINEGHPAILRKKPRKESFVLPTSQCRVPTTLPDMLLPTPEMEAALQELTEVLEDPSLLYKFEQRVHDPETGPSTAEMLDYTPESDEEL
ncbi:unnamed protein product, partial [Urochloa humidicola]